MVFKIRSLDLWQFSASSVFFLDTNVLLDLHHPPSTGVDPVRADTYSNFIARLRKSGCSLRISSFNVQEAFHVVETLALKAYNDANNTDMKRKAFRKNFRSVTSIEQSSLWCQIKENYTIEDAVATKDMLESFIKSYNQHYCDPIDYLLTENHPSCAIITSDPDFSQDSSLSVFTF